MALKSTAWKLLLKLPEFIKFPILRRVVGFPDTISDTLRFKVAETEDELSQAFKLLHEAYVNEKLMQPHPSKMRVTKYHSLPSTTTLIAIENNEVVATVSLIRQSAFGLPMKEIFELGHIPAQSRLGEVSALAIKKEYLGQKGRILFPLLKYVFHYSRDHFGVSHFVIAVNPKWVDFYTSILLYKKLSKKAVANYSFVNGAPAVGCILDLSTVPEMFYKVYSRRPKKRNLYNFFVNLERKNMEFPLRKNCIISNPVMTPKLFEHFFIEHTECLSTMTENEISILRDMYDHPDYLKLIPQNVSNILAMRRRSAYKKLEATLQGRLQVSGERSCLVDIHGVSRAGLTGYINPEFVDFTRTQKILVNIEDMSPCYMEGQFVRFKKDGEFGFLISESCSRWLDFVKKLESRLHLTDNEELPSPIRFTRDLEI